MTTLILNIKLDFAPTDQDADIGFYEFHLVAFNDGFYHYAARYPIKIEIRPTTEYIFRVFPDTCPANNLEVLKATGPFKRDEGFAKFTGYDVCKKLGHTG